MSRPGIVLTGQQRIAELAKQAPQMSFTSLNKYLTIDWLREAYRQTRKDGAVGIDGQTAADYEANLESNLQSLLERAHKGTYFAPPVRRAFIPKGPGSTELRGIGIPCFEDKLLQRAVVMLLEPIYEQDFLPSSYGFRPGRSQHQMVAALSKELARTGGGWIVEVDIRKFFDTIDLAHLRALIKQRVNDGVVERLINKWLKAGVCYEERITYPESGCPQGGVISPLASNVYLHYVLDLWFEKMVKPCLRGSAHLYRWADDFVMVFRRREDAARVLEALPKRFAKYGLSLHPDKTRLIDFVSPGDWHNRGSGKPGTFNLLGFTFYWGKTRNGKWAPKQKTAKDRLQRSIRKVFEWCRKNRHKPLSEQQQALNAKVRGHYQYYGVTSNNKSLSQFERAVQYAWRFWLNRRSRKADMPWKKFYRLKNRYPLIRPFIAHPAPAR